MRLKYPSNLSVDKIDEIKARIGLMNTNIRFSEEVRDIPFEVRLDFPRTNMIALIPENPRIQFKSRYIEGVFKKARVLFYHGSYVEISLNGGSPQIALYYEQPSK